MSFKTRLQVACGIAFIMAAGASGVMTQTSNVAAQTQANSEPTFATVATDPTSTSQPKRTEKASSPIVTSIDTNSDKSPESTRDGSRLTRFSNTTNVTKKPMPEASGPVPQPTPSDKWQFIFSPYFWMAGLHGTTGGPNRTVQVDESFGDILHSLKFAFMGVFEAHKGKWAIQTDVEYVSVGDDKATPGPLFSSANAKIKTFVFTPEVGYKVYNNPERGSFVQVLGGTRIWHISSDLTLSAAALPAVEIENSRSWVDGIVGLRGKAALTEKVFFLGRFDVGGGGSKFTYQLFGGLGYHLNKRMALVFGYRDLDVNYDKSNFLFDMSQRGPIVGMAFKF